MFATEALVWFREGQQLFNDLIVNHLETIKQQHSFLAYTGLALVGFFYGILHAVGPGHGKMVVSSYVIANENSLKRGLLVVVASSLLQALTAIAIVLGFNYLLAITQSQAENIEALLKVASYSLICCVGFLLLGQGLYTFAEAMGFRHKRHAHHSHNHAGTACQHVHTPSVEQLKNKDFLSIATMILSIGIRPCTGALLLLFFSLMLGLGWAGVVATFAMAAGTAITTGSLALLAVKSKSLALSFVKKSDRSLLFTYAGLRLIGGAIMFITAALFLVSQLTNEAPMPSASPHPLYKSLNKGKSNL